MAPDVLYYDGRNPKVHEAAEFSSDRATVNVPAAWKVGGVVAMRIGVVAHEVGIPAKTIRFWEDEGLVPPPGRTSSGYRDYQPEVVERLTFIRHAQAGGLTLNQIRQILEIGASGDAACEHVGRVVADRLAEVETRIAELEDTGRHLRALARRAAVQDPAECEGYCAIITG